jgi:hypothetical protein
MKCEQHNCEADARAAFRWPGTPELAACLPHILWATKIAVTLGFELDIRSVARVEAARADEAANWLDRHGHDRPPITEHVSPLAETLIAALEASAPPGQILHGALKVALIAEANAVARVSR